MKNYLYIFILMPFLSCTINNNQSFDSIHNSINNLEKVVKTKGNDTFNMTLTLHNAFALSDNNSDRIHDSLIAVVCRLKGISLLSVEKYTDARYYFEKGLNTGKRHLKNNEDIIVRCYRNIGVTHYNQRHYKEALTYFDSVNITKNDVSNLSMKIDNLTQSATCYQELKDYESSEKLAKEACIIAESIYKELEIAPIYIKYATMLNYSQKHQSSIDYLQKAIDIYSNYAKRDSLSKRDSAFWANSYFFQALAFKNLGNYNYAIPLYLKSININEKLNNIDNTTAGFMNIANTYRLNKEFNKARKAIYIGLRILNNTELPDYLLVRKGNLYVGLNEILMDNKQYKDALIAQDSAISILSHAVESAELSNILSLNRFNVLSVFIDKAFSYIELSKNGQDTEGYAKALKLFEKLTALADDIRADYISDDAKLTLAETAKPAFEKAIELCHTLYEKTQDTTYLQRAFTFVEQSRSMVLYENARLETQLPDNLKAENKRIKEMESAVVQKSNNTDALQEYLKQKRLFREKIKAFNKNNLASVAQIRTQLLSDDHTALVEYFVGDSTLFVLTLTNKTIVLHKLLKTTDFEKRVMALRMAVVHEQNRDFMDLSNQFYNDILRGVLSNLSASVHKLIIIPDGVLNYIPFDMLLPEKTNALNNAPFLLKNYTISYGASANLLIAQDKKTARNEAKEIFVGYAPQYYKPFDKKAPLAMRSVLTRDNAYDLPGALEEVQKIKEIVGGTAFLNEKANESAFKKQAPQYKILHLAMHSLVDENNPSNNRLLFTKNEKDSLNDSDLTVTELNSMTLNADLAVLSACNTGFGKLSKGEGVMSVARSFNYAGVPSTVMSLWLAPDAETSGIMIDFYRNLKAKMPKDEALRQAKLSYLNNVHLDDKAAPAFWAAFVLSGNTDVVDFSPPLSTMWVYWVIGFLGLIIIGLLLKKAKVFSKRLNLLD